MTQSAERSKTEQSQRLITLGIETSCDETAVGLYHRQQGLLGHRLFSQIELHSQHGGVVPELASRDHLRKLLPMITGLMEEFAVTPQNLEAIAYTRGPGLIGALMVGSTIAQSLAWCWDVPAVPVHHLEGHLLAPLLATEPTPEPPFICLMVSGGHTMLIEVSALGDYRIIGETLDDAVGEAFDKTAKLLGLGYPGGPAIAKAADSGVKGRFNLSRPMVNRPGLDFSFSGLKTQVRNLVDKEFANTPDEQEVADVALAFEQTVADTLLIKCKRAMQQTGYRTLVVAGGVSANQRLRRQLSHSADQLGWQLHFPPLNLCTDNGAMIALAGSLRSAAGKTSKAFSPVARWSLEELSPIAR